MKCQTNQYHDLQPSSGPTYISVGDRSLLLSCCHVMTTISILVWAEPRGCKAAKAPSKHSVCDLMGVYNKAFILRWMRMDQKALQMRTTDTEQVFNRPPYWVYITFIV